MRLWHIDLLPVLPRQQLLGQHRECCALRGNGWGRNHATVNYVFQYHPRMLYAYHQCVIKEMKKRGYHVDPVWEDEMYRGKKCSPYYSLQCCQLPYKERYPEHNKVYFEACLKNLQNKGIYFADTGLAFVIFSVWASFLAK